MAQVEARPGVLCLTNFAGKLGEALNQPELKDKLLVHMHLADNPELIARTESLMFCLPDARGWGIEYISAPLIEALMASGVTDLGDLATALNLYADFKVAEVGPDQKLYPIYPWEVDNKATRS